MARSIRVKRHFDHLDEILKTPLLTKKEEREIFLEYFNLRVGIFEEIADNKEYIKIARSRVNGRSLSFPSNKPMIFLERHYFQFHHLYSLLSNLKSQKIEEKLNRLSELRDKITYSNLRLVISVVGQFARPGSDVWGDFFQLGVMGLLRAIDGYNHTLGNRFSTFAVHWIKQRVRRYMDETDLQLLRIPTHMAQAFRKFYSLVESGVSEHEAAKEVEQPLYFLRKIRGLKKSVSLDAPVAAGEESLSNFISGEEEVYVNSEKEILSLLEKILVRDKREAYVIQHRFGILCRPKTLEEIAQAMKMTRERVRQIQDKGLRRLRHPKNQSRFYDIARLYPSISPLCDQNIRNFSL